MSTTDFPIGTNVSFKPGPRSTSKVTAKVTGRTDTGYLTTKDAAGTERKVRPGSATRV